jgi:4-hydroxy-tetrahydrodipicolinate synthase
MHSEVHLAKGLWGVLATPFREGGQEFDEDSMRRQVELHQTVGSTGVVALGVFGESARLTPQERVRVVETVRDAAGGLGLVIGLSELETAPAIAAGRALLEAAGRPAALMVQVPTGHTEALTEHLASVNEATGAPLVVQDYPVASGVTITSAELLKAIAELPFIAAVKSEAPPTSRAIAELTAATEVPVFGGLGGLGLLDELMAGASGAMTGFSHPEGLASALQAWEQGGFPAAREAYAPWLPIVNFEAQAGIGLAIRKRILAERGLFDSGAVRPPSPTFPEALLPLLQAHLAHVPHVPGVR